MVEEGRNTHRERKREIASELHSVTPPAKTHYKTYHSCVLFLCYSFESLDGLSGQEGALIWGNTSIGSILPLSSLVGLLVLFLRKTHTISGEIFQMWEDGQNRLDGRQEAARHVLFDLCEIN